MFRDEYKRGHKKQCDRCGSIFMDYETVRDRYDKNLIVCVYGCNDPPHAQDYVKAIRDDPSVRKASPLDWLTSDGTDPTGPYVEGGYWGGRYTAD